MLWELQVAEQRYRAVQVVGRIWRVWVIGRRGRTDRHGLISLAGFRYRVPIILAGEPVEAVVADHLVRIFHREVLVAEHVQRRKPDTEPRQPVQGRRTARQPTSGMTVTRVVDGAGQLSFAGTMYQVGHAWRRRSVQVSIVADSVQVACDGQIVRVHPIRHDRSKEHGAFATPNGRPRHRQDAPAGAGVKATPLRGRPAGRAVRYRDATGKHHSETKPDWLTLSAGRLRSKSLSPPQRGEIRGAVS